MNMQQHSTNANNYPHPARAFAPPAAYYDGHDQFGIPHPVPAQFPHSDVTSSQSAPYSPVIQQQPHAQGNTYLATPPVQYTGVPVNANSGAMGYPPWSVLPKYKVVHLHETTNPFTEIFTLPASLQQEKEGIAGDVNIPDRTRNDHKRMFIAKIKGLHHFCSTPNCSVFMTRRNNMNRHLDGHNNDAGLTSYTTEQWLYRCADEHCPAHKNDWVYSDPNCHLGYTFQHHVMEKRRHPDWHDVTFDVPEWA